VKILWHHFNFPVNYEEPQIRFYDQSQKIQFPIINKTKCFETLLLKTCFARLKLLCLDLPELRKKCIRQSKSKWLFCINKVTFYVDYKVSQFEPIMTFQLWKVNFSIIQLKSSVYQSLIEKSSILRSFFLKLTLENLWFHDGN
jgi:hypothetical protein